MPDSHVCVVTDCGRTQRLVGLQLEERKKTTLSTPHKQFSSKHERGNPSGSERKEATATALMISDYSVSNPLLVLIV